MDNDNEMKRILIVDDSETIRIMLRGFLDNEPYTIAEASNGVEALEEMEKASFDLVITDIVMPEMNGFKLVEEIKEKYEDTKIIVISGIGGRMTAESVLRGLKRSGVRNTLSKPFDKIELIMLIKDVLWPDDEEV